MGMLSLERCHPDYLKARVMVTLFGGYFGSRLMSNIREEKDTLMEFLPVSLHIRGKVYWLSIRKLQMSL